MCFYHYFWYDKKPWHLCHILHRIIRTGIFPVWGHFPCILFIPGWRHKEASPQLTCPMHNFFAFGCYCGVHCGVKGKKTLFVCVQKKIQCHFLIKKFYRVNNFRLQMLPLSHGNATSELPKIWETCAPEASLLVTWLTPFYKGTAVS